MHTHLLLFFIIFSNCYVNVTNESLFEVRANSCNVNLDVVKYAINLFSSF